MEYTICVQSGAYQNQGSGGMPLENFENVHSSRSLFETESEGIFTFQAR